MMRDCECCMPTFHRPQRHIGHLASMPLGSRGMSLLHAVCFLCLLWIGPAMGAGCRLRFISDAGLCNQLGSQVMALLYAVHSKCDLILPPVMHRSGYDWHAQWSFADARSIFDTDSMLSYLKFHGLTLLPTPWQDIRLPGVYPARGSLSMASSAQKKPNPWRLVPSDVQKVIPWFKHDSLVARASELRAAVPQPQGEDVTINIGVPFLQAPIDAIASEEGQLAFNAIRFSPLIQHLAQQVLQGIKSMNPNSSFDAVHLRIEADNPQVQEEKEAAILQNYISLMRMGGLTNSSTVYVASGISASHRARVAEQLKAAGVAGAVIDKTHFIQPVVLQHMLSEAVAAIDYLVMQESEVFIGHGGSSFSYFLRVHRALHNNKMTHLINNIGLRLFDRAFGAIVKGF